MSSHAQILHAVESAHTGDEASRARSRFWTTFAALALAALGYSLLQSMVAPALPNIQRALHTSTTSVTWVFTAFLLSASVATPIAGRLGDMLGRRRVLLIVLCALAAGTIICGTASSIMLLIVGRVLQGLGAGVYPLAFGIVRDEFPTDRAAIGIALIAAILGVGGGLGIVLAGPIVQHFSYHWLFWFPLIAIAVSLVAVIAVVPESSHRVAGHVNLMGAALLSGWLVALLLAVSEASQWHWTSGRTIGLFAVALALAIIWVIAETRSREPLIDMRIMRRRGVWTVNTAGLMLGAGLFGAFVLIPRMVELPTATGVGFGSSITGAGIFLVPATAMVLLVSPLAGRLDKLVGSKVPLVLGTLFAFAGYILLATEHKHRVDIYIATTLLGIGIGFAFASMTNLIVQAVRSDQTGQATGINTVTRFVGGAIGGAVFGSILTSHIAHGVPSNDGFTIAFTIGAITVAVGAAAAIAVPGRPHTKRAEIKRLA
ncbi:MAG TPA: MFS transporter [Candidatus Dormibacteraeota bacterium]|nr:MFS transporter [Candidatus Dormibacteraeota bacterium]